MVTRSLGTMPGKGMRKAANRSMKESGNDPTEVRAARYYRPCGTRSGHGSLDRGLSRHKTPIRKRVQNKTPSSTRRKGLATEKVEIREGEDREHGLCPEGSTSKPRPRTLENQALEGPNRLRSVCFPPTPLKGLVAPYEFKSAIKESFHHVSSRDSSSPASKAM